MYQPWIDDDTIDEMDVWATYFQMDEDQMETMLFIDLVLAGCASAPAVMSAMSWLAFIPKEDIEFTFGSAGRSDEKACMERFLAVARLHANR